MPSITSPAAGPVLSVVRVSWGSCGGAPATIPLAAVEHAGWSPHPRPLSQGGQRVLGSTYLSQGAAEVYMMCGSWRSPDGAVCSICRRETP